MSPQAEALEIPASLTLRPRPLCQPTEERPLLRPRDDANRVLALVERWVPAATN